MASRYYSSVAAVTTLSNGVSPSGTSFIVGSTSGFPVQTPFTLLIDEGTQSEEIVSVVNVAGTTLTVTRGEDGTVAVAHDPGARVRHAMTARDLRESREHEAATTNVHGIASTSALVTSTQLSAHTGASTGVHGVSGSVVGTSGAQTLTSKTLSGSSNTFNNIPQSAVSGLTDAWQSYTPSFNGALGNGASEGSFIQVGKTVHFQITVTAGSTTTLPAGGLQVGLPVTAKTFGGVTPLSGVGFRTGGNGGLIYRAANANAVWIYNMSIAVYTPTTEPGFVSGSSIRLNGTYEAA